MIHECPTQIILVQCLLHNKEKWRSIYFQLMNCNIRFVGHNISSCWTRNQKEVRNSKHWASETFQSSGSKKFEHAINGELTGVRDNAHACRILCLDLGFCFCKRGVWARECSRSEAWKKKKSGSGSGEGIKGEEMARVDPTAHSLPPWTWSMLAPSGQSIFTTTVKLKFWGPCIIVELLAAV